MRFEEFIGGSYEPRSRACDNERTTNMYVERIESPTGKTKTSAVLLSRPGLKTFSTLGLADDPPPAGPRMMTATLTYGNPFLSGPDAYGPNSIGSSIVSAGYDGPQVWNPPGYNPALPEWWLNLAYSPDATGAWIRPHVPVFPFTARYLQISVQPAYPRVTLPLLETDRTVNISVLLPGASTPITVDAAGYHFSMPLPEPVVIHQGDIWKAWTNSQTYNPMDEADFFVELTTHDGWYPLQIFGVLL